LSKQTSKQNQAQDSETQTKDKTATTKPAVESKDKSKSAPKNTPDKSKPAKSEHAKPKSVSGLAILSGVHFVITLILAAVVGWFVYNGKLKLDSQQQSISQQQQQVSSIKTIQDQVARQVEQQLQANTLQQNTELTSLKETIAAFLKQNQHTRRDWLIAESEYLVKLANHRLILANDLTTAIQALQAADNRLREVGNPRLIPLREALTGDIEKLKSLPDIDYVGISLKLNALEKQVDSLPLGIPDPKTASIQKAEKQSAKKVDGWQQLPGAIWNDLMNLFRIRHHDAAIQPLLSPEQRFYLTQNLKLQIEQARLALLNNHPQIFKDRLTQAQKWINQYFDNKHDLTRSVSQSIKQLAQTNITVKLPDISQSLKKLRLLNPSLKTTNAKSNTTSTLTTPPANKE